MNIDVFCASGSPIGIIPTDIYTRGIGGAELSLVSLMETFAARGHRVRVYNDPKKPANYSGVDYLPLGAFDTLEPRDALIYFRSPHQTMPYANGRKIFWSCDQYTEGNYATDIFPYMDAIVCISPLHIDYFKANYKVDETKLSYIDLGVRLTEYNNSVEKIKGRAIFCSVPHRGLHILHAIWPRVLRAVPNASLVITSDYTLWGSASPDNTEHKLQWLRAENVQFMGNIPRTELVKHQLRAEVMLYPSIYQEMFCIALAECQVAGAVPVISETGGAMDTTQMYGYRVAGTPGSEQFSADFADSAVEALKNGVDADGIAASRVRFDWHRIAKLWETTVLK